MLHTNVDESTIFYKLYLVEAKLSMLSQRFSSVLHRHGWMIRKTAVLQKVPKNWKQIAQEDSIRITQKMRAAGVNVLINANQSFFCSTQRTVKLLLLLLYKELGKP